MSKKATRSSFSAVSKAKENDNNFYISEYQQVQIHHAEFNRELLLICSKNINIYDIEQMIKITKIPVESHFAAFVPFSNYLVYVESQDEERQIVVHDYIKNTICAKMRFSFEINSLKCSRRTILLASLEHIYVLHFPSLKPIYEGIAGNGIRIVYDISR